MLHARPDMGGRYIFHKLNTIWGVRGMEKIRYVTVWWRVIALGPGGGILGARMMTPVHTP